MKNQSSGYTMQAGRSRFGTQVTHLDARGYPLASFTYKDTNTDVTAWKGLATRSSDCSAMRIWTTSPGKPLSQEEVQAKVRRI